MLVVLLRKPHPTEALELRLRETGLSALLGQKNFNGAVNKGLIATIHWCET